VRELDHGFAGGDLLIRLVAHHDVDQDPARVPRLRIQSSAGVQENISRIWIEGGAISPP